MHIHNRNWEAAERIAQEKCPEELTELFIQRARDAIENVKKKLKFLSF